MNKNQLVDAVAASVGDRRTATAAVEAVLDTITRTVAAGERVALTGFGVFEKADRAARAARNPATGASVQVPATSVPRFRAGTGFKDVVGGKRPAPQPVDAPAADGTAATPAPRRAATRAGASRAAAQTDDQPEQPAKAAAKPAKAATKQSKAAEPSKAAGSSKPTKAAGRSSKAAGAGKPATASKAGTTSAPSDKAAKAGAKGKAKDSKKGGPAGKAKAGKGKTSTGKSR